MPLHDLTLLQFLVLSPLLEGELEGRDLRNFLAQKGRHLGRPAFYRLMSRLEDAKLVKGWYESREIDGDTVRIRAYKITAPGARACEAMHNLVTSAAKNRLGLEGV